MKRTRGNGVVTLEQFRQSAARLGPPKRICLIDADRWAAETLQEILRAFRYAVDTFHDPNSALDALETLEFDVVLLAELPQPKRDFILDIRTADNEKLRDIPIVVFSHVCSEALETRMKEYGAACLLPSTAAPERIHDTICELLGINQARDEEVAGWMGPPIPHLGMLVTNAGDAGLQNPFVNARWPLDLFFSPGEALLAIARTPYQAFVVVEHRTDTESGGVQLISIVRQMIDPTGTVLPILVISSAEDAKRRFMSIGANKILSLPISVSLVECVEILLEQAALERAALADIAALEQTPTPSQPQAAESKKKAEAGAAPTKETANADASSKPAANSAEKSEKKERRAEEGPPPPPPPVLKNKRAKKLMEENSDLFKTLFPAAKEFII